tara:strand:- start:1769 stop:2119 length:351 start_codon:yes stop_codon:yes gene_type:complete
MARALGIAAFIAVVLVASAWGISFNDITPTALHAFVGGERTEICGCGFSVHKSVVCVYNAQFFSTNAYIIDDGTIICEAPAFPASYFIDGLPQNWALDVVFDDSSRHYVGDIRIGN